MDRRPFGPIASLLLVLAVSAGYEALFLRHGIGWLFDEGWPLYAAWSLQRGGVLYGDVFWVFPPGHLLPAWIGLALSPTGIVPTRAIYAAFAVALCGGLYLLGRRLMPGPFALLAALMVALAAPRAHMQHHVFGYRYLVFGVLALLAFDRRLRSGQSRFVLLAGGLTGVAACFRLTPAVAVACGIAAGILAADPRTRRRARDGACYAAGIALVAAPVLLWFAHGVGLECIWREVVVRPLHVTAAQALPFPRLALPGAWTRAQVIAAFIALQLYLYPLLYLGYAGWLAFGWRASARRGEPFPRALLLAVVVFGGVYFLRVLGRSDEAHLVSALPPACLLLAHASSGACDALARRIRLRGAQRRILDGAFVVLALWAWVWLGGSDRYLASARRGRVPLEVTGGAIRIPSAGLARNVDSVAVQIREWTRPGDRILTATNAPLLYVLAGRAGPGHFDTLMPGTFLEPAEERRFVARLEADPPAVVIWPTRPFDGRAERSLARGAPQLAAWILERYGRAGPVAAAGAPGSPPPRVGAVDPRLRAALRDQLFRILLPKRPEIPTSQRRPLSVGGRSAPGG